MAAPFYERLASYYESLGETLRAEKKRSATLSNISDIGQVRESSYAKILVDHLPQGCNVMFGGFLFDAEGHESPQVDIIVCSDAVYTFKVEDKSFVSVDGTLAAFQVKSTLTKKNLVEVLDSYAKFPHPQELEDWQLAGIDEARNYELLPYKVVFA